MRIKSLSDNVKKLFEAILHWHKDRKSYIPSSNQDARGSQGRINDPHVMWPSGLFGRGTGRNPYWRLNTMVSCAVSDLESKILPAWLHPDLECCVQHAKPRVVQLCKTKQYLDALHTLNKMLFAADMQPALFYALQ